MPKTKQIDENTLAILSRVTVEENNVFLTCGQLDRKQYQAVNEVLVNIGGKWNRKAKAHVFADDPTLKLEYVLNSGEITPPEKNGYFPTPPAIAQMIIGYAQIKPGMTVLEPSAGQGGIVDFIPADIRVDCYELLPDNVQTLLDKGHNVSPADFLSINPNPIYHRVVMNPPFSYQGHPQADIDHVTHALRFIRPDGGRLVSIMSSGVLFRENKKTTEFREMIADRGGYFERLPDKAFAVSGTNVNTCFVVVDL